MFPFLVLSPLFSYVSHLLHLTRPSDLISSSYCSIIVYTSPEQKHYQKSPLSVSLNRSHQKLPPMGICSFCFIRVSYHSSPLSNLLSSLTISLSCTLSLCPFFAILFLYLQLLLSQSFRYSYKFRKLAY